MAIPQWPNSLPNELLQRGYNHSTQDVALRSSMEAGPAKVRRRITQSVQNVTGRMLLTEEQLGILRDFYNYDLDGGTLRFAAADPVSLEYEEFRFTGPVKWSMTSGYYDVTFEFEILP